MPVARLRRRGRIRSSGLRTRSLTSADQFGELLERDAVLRRLTALDDDLRLVVLHHRGDLRRGSLPSGSAGRSARLKSRLNRALAKMREGIEPAGAARLDP
jgi:hypothetical protein